MKRSETIALVTMLSLIAVTLALAAMALYSGLWFDRGFLNIALVAGAAAALTQMLVAILAYWGLKLARQNYELNTIPGESAASGEAKSSAPSMAGFKMSAPDDVDDEVNRRRAAGVGKIVGRVVGGYVGGKIGEAIGHSISAPEAGYRDSGEMRTLDTGFQRTVVIITASLMLLVAIGISYLLYRQYHFYSNDPSQIFHIARIDPLIFTVAAGAAGAYFALFMSARKDASGFGDAISGLLTLALPGAIAVIAGVTLSWAGVAYATEFAAGVVVFILVIQALELFVNAMRSYSGVEELDQDPVDLQATPLVPMLSSVWINGLRMLTQQSFGVSEHGEKGVISRMMPRVIVAVIVIGVAASCIHVVPVGHKAVLERFGQVDGYAEGAAGVQENLLEPGVHILLPWPMDKLILIPDQRLQECDVGAELQQREGMEDLELWNVPHAKANEEGQFITGNVNSTGKFVGRILESYGKVWWRVSNPGKYYMALSHSDAFEAVGTLPGTTAMPMNQLMVSRIANRALTRAYAEVNGDTVMISGRAKLEERMRFFMERDLESLDAGIEVVAITVNDMHPPFGNPDDTAGRKGPAGAFEDVVAAQQDKQTIIHMGRLEANRIVTQGLIEKTQRISQATIESTVKLKGAEGSAAYQLGTIAGYREYPFAAASRQQFMDLMDAIAPNQKVLLGPGVEPPIIIQEDKGGSSAIPLN